MARMRVEIDGVTKFDGEVPDVYLPDQPNLYPEALGAPGAGRPAAPLGPIPPLARIFLIGVLGQTLAQWVNNAKQLQPIEAEWVPNPANGGGTITISGPPIMVDAHKPQ